MTEAAIPYNCRLRQPEYFFLETPDTIIRLRVPWLCVRTVLEILQTPQGAREHAITYDHMPGPATKQLISDGAMAFLLEWAGEEGWIESLKPIN